MFDVVKFANIQEVLLKYRASGQNSTIQHKSNVHKSIIDVMKKQFKENLSIDLTNNELELLYGKNNNLFLSLYNLEEANLILDSVYSKIINANKLCKLYDQKKLEEILDHQNTKLRKKIDFLYIPKKIFKFVLRPVYSRFLYRIDQLIDLKIMQNNQMLLYKMKNTIKTKK